MKRRLWFTKAAAVASSLVLAGAYVHMRSGGTLAGLTIQEATPAPIGSERSLLPGSKSKVFGFSHATSPSDLGDPAPAPRLIHNQETTSPSFNSASLMPHSLSYPKSLPKPPSDTYAPQSRTLMPGSKSIVISESQWAAVPARAKPTGPENPLATQPPKHPIAIPGFQAKP